MVAGTLLSLLLALPSTDGLVVCADRRNYRSASGSFDDTLRKLRPAGDQAVYGVVGMWRRENAAGAQLFNVYDLVDAGLPELNLLAPDADIVQWSKKAVFNPLAVSKVLNQGLPPGLDQPLIQVFFFYLSNGAPTWAVLGIQTNDKGGSPRAGMQIGSFWGMRWGSGGTMLTELDSGKDPRFDDMRKHPLLSRFFKDKEHPKLLSTTETLKLLRWTIAETSRRIGWLKPSAATLFGPTSDCAVITSRGVKWYLHGDASAAPSP